MVVGLGAVSRRPKIFWPEDEATEAFPEAGKDASGDKVNGNEHLSISNGRSEIPSKSVSRFKKSPSGVASFLLLPYAEIRSFLTTYIL